MKQIVLLAKHHSPRQDYILPILERYYEVILVTSIEEAENEISNDGVHTIALLIDNPSNLEGAEQLIHFVEEQNDYMLAIPVLLLTDEENKNQDDHYLGDTVIALICQGDSERIVRHRIEKSAKSINSASFDDFSDMLKQLPSLIYLKDTKGRYAFCSQNWHHIDYERGTDNDIRGKTDLEVRRNPVNGRLAYEQDMNVIRTGKGVSYLIEEDNKGQPEFFEIIKMPLFKDNGQVRGIIALVNNVTEQEELRRKLRSQSIIDPLTGLYNRLRFNEFVSELSEKDYPIGIISADCDGLKKVNDGFGHAMGDKYICMARDLLNEVSPSNATKFRMGGDEFLILIPNSSHEEVKELIEKLTEEAANYHYNEVHLEISFGGAVANDPSASFDASIARSDKAMYRAKRKKKK